MSLILIISIVIRLLAMGWSIVLLRRMKDWRMGFLTLMLALMALRQILTLLTEKKSWPVSTAPVTELPGLLVSVMAFLTVFFLGCIIIERQQAEEEIQKQHDANTKLAVIDKEQRELQDWINTFDTFVGKFDVNGIGIIFNKAPLEASGLTMDEVVGKYFPDTLWWSHSAREQAKIVECFARAKAGLPSRIETNFRNAAGAAVPIIFNCQPVMDDAGSVKYVTAEGKIIVEELKLRNALQEEKENLEKRVTERTSALVSVNERLTREISERKQAELALLESENFFSGTLNAMLTFVAVLEPDGKVKFINNTPLEKAGVSLNDVKGKMFHDAFWWQYSEQARQQIKEDIKICATGKTLVHDIEFQTAKGELLWIEYSMHPIYDENGKIKYLVPEGRDITERKQAEDHIQHLQSVLKAIRDINQLIVHEKNRQKLLQGVCDILNQTRNYKLIWMGVPLEGVQRVVPVAQAGFEEGYLKTIKISCDDSASGRGPTGTAIRSGTPSIMRDIAGDPRYEPWREEALKRGYTSSIAIPLVYKSRVFGALNVYTVLPDAFDEEEIDLLVEVGQDIALALHNIEMAEERQRAEVRLHKSEARLAAILDLAADAIISMNEEQCITLFNQAAEKIFGYREQEVLGKPHDILLPDHLVANHRQLIENFAGVTFPTGEMGKASQEIFGKRKDGSTFPVDASISRLVLGEETTYTVILRDITALKKAEALLLGRNTVLEKLAMGAPLLEVLSVLVEISEKNSPGMLSSVLLLDKEKKHLLHEAAPSLPDFYNEAINGLKIGPDVGSCGTAAYTGKRVIIEDIMTHPNWIGFRELAQKAGLRACWSEPIVSSTDQILGTFALYYREPRLPDSSELEFIKSTSHLAGIAIEKKQTEEALQRAYDGLEIKVAERTRELALANIQLKEMDRLKSEFLATMSHELRTPLNSIIGFVGIILQGITGEINEEQKKQLSMVYGSAKHLLSLINDILDLSRIESGKMEVSVQKFKIEEVISKVAQTLSPMISQKGLQLVTNIPATGPELLNDRKKILQILLNLVNNAVKFTNKGEIKIDCTMDNHNVRVSISDTGIGIKEENMSCLFEAFRQADGTAQRRYQGAGLGLYLCRMLVTLLNGEIWAESQYGKGSRFTFTLPVSYRERKAT
jgi:PAS domain S-box-containing protein